MLASWPELDTLVVAIGGGGLISGIATGRACAQALDRVVGVETQRFPSMYHALRGHQGEFEATTIAEGHRREGAGELTKEIISRLVAEVMLVDEGEIEKAIVMLLEIEKTVVEGAGRAARRASLEPGRFKGKKVGLVLGGGNIDPLMLSGIIERAWCAPGASRASTSRSRTFRARSRR
jgi:threonine dehydratase